MRLPRLDIGRSFAPAQEQMLSDSRSLRPQPLAARERFVEVCAGLIVGAVVIVMATAFDTPHGAETGPAIALTLSYALAARVRFSVGVGFTSPTQLLLVPMLFILSAPLVPLAVMVGLVLSKVPDVIGESQGALALST